MKQRCMISFMPSCKFQITYRGGKVALLINAMILHPLRLKAPTMCEDPKLLAAAMKSYSRAKDLNTRDCTLKRSELFGFTKHKLNTFPQELTVTHID